jgi:hypothetical protein
MFDLPLGDFNAIDNRRDTAIRSFRRFMRTSGKESEQQNNEKRGDFFHVAKR